MTFKPKNTPWNKGKPHKPNGRNLETQFQPGILPKTARPENEMYLRKEHEAVYWWIRPTGSRRAMPYHRHRWIELNGEIPEGHAVIFKDGNTMNIEDSNIILVSRAELMRRNQAKCDRRAAGLASWRTRTGLSFVDQILQGAV